MEEYLWAGAANQDIFDEPDSKIDEMLDHLDRANIRVLRVAIDFRLETDPSGGALPIGRYDDCILNQIDSLMVKAKKKGILLMIAFHQYNWINQPFTISAESYGWRRCKTPVLLYELSLVIGAQSVYDPYSQRGWALDYLTNEDAKEAYKQRVSHILDHVNPYFDKPWKDLNDLVWAWELQSEPDNLFGPWTSADLKNWLTEMASYVKSITPDTYVALGTMSYYDFGDIPEADIYTYHWYKHPDSSDADTTAVINRIEQFEDEIGQPYGKLLLIEEFNVVEISPTGAYRGRTPGDVEREPRFETMMDTCMSKRVPWIFWEYGYLYGGDDIWHANNSQYP